jgi:GNAT superfamily N-acetyltransferase
MFVIQPLARHPQLVALIAGWYKTQWPDWYGPTGPGDVHADLQAFSASERVLPVALVVFDQGQPIGVGALKAVSIPSHRHLSPWAAAGYVLPQRRGCGAGAALLAALVAHAGKMGHARVYCATRTAESLLLRSGWSVHEVTRHDGQALTVFHSAASV